MALLPKIRSYWFLHSLRRSEVQKFICPWAMEGFAAKLRLSASSMETMNVKTQFAAPRYASVTLS